MKLLQQSLLKEKIDFYKIKCFTSHVFSPAYIVRLLRSYHIKENTYKWISKKRILNTTLLTYIYLIIFPLTKINK